MLLVSGEKQLAVLPIPFKRMIYVGRIFTQMTNSILNQLEGVFIEKAKGISFRAKFRMLVERYEIWIVGWKEPRNKRRGRGPPTHMHTPQSYNSLRTERTKKQ